MKFKPNFCKVFYLNFIIMLHLSLCLALLSLLPEMARQNKYSYLGNLSIITIYITELIADIIAPAYLKVFNFKFGLTFQALLTVPAFFTSYYIAQCVNEPGAPTVCHGEYLTPISLLGCSSLGIGLGGYFILQNYYISKCVQHDTHDLFFSTAYVLMGGAFLISGVIGEVGIIIFGRKDFFLYLAFIQIALSLTFLLVPEPNRGLSHVEQINDSYVTHSRRNSLVDVMEAVEPTVLQNLKDIYAQFKNPRVLFQYPVFLATGIVLGYEYGFLYEFVTKTLAKDNLSQDIVNRMTGRVFQIGGVAQILAGIAIIFVKKVFTTREYAVLYGNMLAVVVFLSYANNFILSYSFVGVIEFILGFTDISGQLISCITISEEFQDSMSIYGIYFFCQNLAISFMAFSGMIFGQSVIFNLIIVLAFQILLTQSTHIHLRAIKEK